MGCGCQLTVDPVAPRTDDGHTRYLGCAAAASLGQEPGGSGAVTFCTAISSYRARPADRADLDRSGFWAGVQVGDLVQASSGGVAGPWWRVLAVTDRGEVCIGGDVGVTFWAKPNPTPWEHSQGWHALDPVAQVRIVSPGARIGGPTVDQAVALVRDVLGGKEIG